MLTQGGDVEAQALRLRAWTISTIARHLDRDPKTIRADVNGQRQPGRRASTRVDPLAAFAPYLSARFVDDPHLWASALFDEVVPLGYGASYVSFARQLRRAGAGLRPHCEPCAGVSGRPTIEIDHPAGAERQWYWFERRKAPWGGTADVLLGTLPHSSRVRGVLAESLDQPHLIEAIDAVLRRFGGTPRPRLLPRGAPRGADRADVAFESAPDGIALERLVLEDLGSGRTRLTVTSLVESFEARDAFLASGMEHGVREAYQRLDELLAD